MSICSVLLCINCYELVCFCHEIFLFRLLFYLYCFNAVFVCSLLFFALFQCLLFAFSLSLFVLSVCLLSGWGKGVFCVKNRFRLYFAFLFDSVGVVLRVEIVVVYVFILVVFYSCFSIS